MKKVMLTALLLALGFAGAAQLRQAPAAPNTRPEREEVAKDRVERAREHLNLTEDQVAEWYKIHAQFINEKNELERKTEQELQKAKEEMEAKLKSTLTEEQAAKFTLSLERMKRFRSKHGPKH